MGGSTPVRSQLAAREADTQIITPAAVAAVRGTDFRVAAEQQAPVSRNEVLEGEVGVGDSARTQLVPAGFGLVTETGKEQEPPRALLPAPELSGNGRLQQRLPLRISWPPVADARGYRVQIAPDRDFQALIGDRGVESEQTDFADLPDGRYAVRVRAIDEVGLEGLNAVHEFELAARPFAPELLDPEQDVVLNDALPRFSWSKVNGASAYRFQLATDAGFDAIVVETVSTENALNAETTLAAWELPLAHCQHHGRQSPGTVPGTRAIRLSRPPPNAENIVNRSSMNRA